MVGMPAVRLGFARDLGDGLLPDGEARGAACASLVIIRRNLHGFGT